MEDGDRMVPHGCAKWEPELGPEDVAYVDRMRAEIGPRIRFMARLREVLGMTQVEAARALSMSQAGFSKRERSGPRGLMAIKRLADVKGARLRIALELADGTVVDLSDDVEAMDAPALLDEVVAS